MPSVKDQRQEKWPPAGCRPETADAVEAFAEMLCALDAGHVGDAAAWRKRLYAAGWMASPRSTPRATSTPEPRLLPLQKEKAPADDRGPLRLQTAFGFATGTTPRDAGTTPGRTPETSPHHGTV
jgi:hypothetical protein